MGFQATSPAVGPPLEFRDKLAERFNIGSLRRTKRLLGELLGEVIDRCQDLRLVCNQPLIEPDPIDNSAFHSAPAPSAGIGQLATHRAVTGRRERDGLDRPALGGY